MGSASVLVGKPSPIRKSCSWQVDDGLSVAQAEKESAFKANLGVKHLAILAILALPLLLLAVCAILAASQASNEPRGSSCSSADLQCSQALDRAPFHPLSSPGHLRDASIPIVVQPRKGSKWGDITVPRPLSIKVPYSIGRAL